MPRVVVRLPSVAKPLLDIVSHGRAGPARSDGGLSGAQIEAIRRTVRRTPEVMVKVTGGGKTVGAVAAHLAYISHHGELEIETDEGQRVPEDDQEELLEDWHLELSSGQYRAPGVGKQNVRKVKLVHNIVLSMPSPTPPGKVLAAARVFAREKFGAQHRYALALHTHQKHPHVHLVVKAEREDGRGRLHIDKAMLREWPVVAGWMGIAAALDSQGEIILARDVRYFAKHLPPVLTDRERLAKDFIQHMKTHAHSQDRQDDKPRQHAIERTR